MEHDWEGTEPPASGSLVLPQLPDTSGARPRLTLIGDVNAKRIDWLEDELVARGMLTGLLAPGGTGKGLYGIHLSVKIAERGERTLFLCSEDALDYIVKPRFEAAGSDGRLAQSLDLALPNGGTRELRFPSDLFLLEQAIEAMQPALVVIDPMMGYLDTGLKLSENNHVRSVLGPLIELARKSGAAILPVYHLGKDRSRGAVGSVAFEDACRQVLTVARDDEDEDVRHLELTKTNTGRSGYGRKLRIVEVPITIDGETVPMAKLVDEGRSGKSVAKLLAKQGGPGPDPMMRAVARRAISEMVKAAEGRGVSSAEIYELVMQQAGVSKATVHRAFQELREDDLIGANPHRDEGGHVTSWEWYARPALLLDAGED